MADIATLAIELEARTAQFERQLKRSDQQIRKLTKSTKGLERGFGGLRRAGKNLAGVIGGGLFINQARKAAELARQIKQVSERVGLTAENYQVLRNRTEALGVPTAALDTSLQRLARRAGDARRGVAESVLIFDDLGVSVNNVDGSIRSTEQVLTDFSRAIADSEKEGKGLSRTVKLLDTEGGQLLPLILDIGQGTLDFAREAQRASNVLDDEMIESLNRARVATEQFNTALGIRSATLFATILEGNAGLLEWYTRTMATSINEQNQWLQSVGLGSRTLAGFSEWLLGISSSMLDYRVAIEEAGDASRRNKHDLSTPFGQGTTTGIQTQVRTLADEIQGANEIALSSTLSAAQSMTNVWEEFVTTGKLNFADFARSVASDLLRVISLQLIIKGLAGAGLGSLGLPGFNPFANAKGNAFAGGQVVPFASGGVVSQPTFFGMSGGRTGVAGEAGTEGILPLKRTRSGALGVQVAGGGGAASSFAPTVVVNVSNPQGGEREGQQFGQGVSGEITRELRNLIRAHLRDESRPGGYLRPLS